VKCAVPPAAPDSGRTVRGMVRPFLAGALFLLVPNAALFSHAQDRVQPRASSCQGQIKYRMGTLDPRFGITREDFRRAIEDASETWAIGERHFKYDAKGKLRINLVYDTRQEMTQRVIAVRAGVSARMKEADVIGDKLLPLRDKFHILEASYSDQLASYEQATDSFNQEARRLNNAGGASGAEFKILSGKRQSLRNQQVTLEEKRQELNRSTNDMNELIRKRNALLNRANAEAGALNSSNSIGIQFEEGIYAREGDKEWIDIFQFESKASLRVILAHELGHALGIKHNANPSSIMSPLIHTDRLALTAEDENGLKAACPP
jgi:hypothetical protein